MRYLLPVVAEIMDEGFPEDQDWIDIEKGTQEVPWFHIGSSSSAVRVGKLLESRWAFFGCKVCDLRNDIIAMADAVCGTTGGGM